MLKFLKWATKIIGIFVLAVSPLVIGACADKYSTKDYEEFVVVDKLTDYTYNKYQQNQVNRLLLKNSTGNIVSKNVAIETHYVAKVGDVIEFEKDGMKYFEIGTIVEFILIFMTILLGIYYARD